MEPCYPDEVDSSPFGRVAGKCNLADTATAMSSGASKAWVPSDLQRTFVPARPQHFPLAQASGPTRYIRPRCCRAVQEGVARDVRDDDPAPQLGRAQDRV